jgi:hypothetical protein
MKRGDKGNRKAGNRQTSRRPQIDGAAGDEGTRERKGKASIMLVLLTSGAVGEIEGSTKKGKEGADKRWLRNPSSAPVKTACHVPGAGEGVVRRGCRTRKGEEEGRVWMGKE